MDAWSNMALFHISLILQQNGRQVLLLMTEDKNKQVRCQEDFSLYFLSRGFMVSGLTFKSLIHFMLIFVSAVRKESSFILLYVDIQFSQHHLLKRQSFPFVCSWSPYQKLIACICIGLFLGSLFCVAFLYSSAILF